VDDASGPVLAMDIEVAADHGQIYVHGAGDRDGGDPFAENPYLDALEDATSSGRFVGAAGNLVDVLTPCQWNFHTPMRVEVWAAEPAADTERWDHEVDIDLDVLDGELSFEGSGGARVTTVEVPADRYRARISGAGFTGLGAPNGDDSPEYYRVRLWPRAATSPPVLRRYWPGWNDYR
jgi:hypothetical protein